MSLWFGRRKLWVRLQFCNGVLSAYLMIYDLCQDDLLGAAIAGVCVFGTALWRIPPPSND
jgi:hypothetical protein